MATGTCTCCEVFIGSEGSGSYNLNFDCPLHGTGSTWWNSPEQTAKRQEQNDRLRILQAKAKAARELRVGCHGRPVEILEPAGDCDVCDLARSIVDRWREQRPVK
jgi:hypothetical protein